MDDYVGLKTDTKLDITVLFAVVIVLVNSGYYRSTVTGSYLPLILLIATTGLFLVFCKDRKILLNSGYMLVLTFTILFSALANFNMPNLLSGGRVLVTMLCSYFLTQLLDIKKFTKTLVFCMEFIVVLAFVLNILIEFGVAAFPRLDAYYDLFIITQKVDASRVSGIFWEPGVFASMILYTMILEWYIVGNRVKVFHLALLVFGVFLSGSTAGILLVFFVLFGLILRRLDGKKHGIAILLFVIVMAVLISQYQRIFIMLVQWNPDIFGKLLETESTTTSTRINGPWINLEVFFQKPFLGWGFTDSATEVLKLMPQTGADKVIAQTSTSTQILSAIGLGGFAYTLGFFAPMFSKKKLPHLQIELKLIIAVVALLIVNKEPHLFIVLSWMLMFYMNQNPKPIEELRYQRL